MLIPPSSLADIRQHYQSGQNKLLQTLLAKHTASAIRRALRQHTRLADTMLGQLWRAHHLDKTELALLAVGGFGRMELFPHSDLDLLLLLPNTAPDATTEAQISAFIASCWDTGLTIGSSVRTVHECLQAAAQDITIQTALLDQRLIAGSSMLYQALEAQYQAAMQPSAFYQQKTLEMRQRYSRFDDTPYALEPDCKESPGGLRDLHTVRWVAKAAGYGSSWQDMYRLGLISYFELSQFRRHHALLHLIRLHLHLCAGRREDRLLFDLQEQVAQRILAVKSDTARNAPPSLMRAGERLMKRYYRSAKAVMQLSQIVLRHISELAREPSRNRHVPIVKTHPLQAINSRFFKHNGLLEIATDQLYQNQPHSILETFLLYQQEADIKDLSARTLRGLYNARPLMNRAFRSDPVNRQQFLHILQAPHKVAKTLQLMDQTSVLEGYLGVFHKIVGQMQHDLFHVYTVDQHILRVVRNVLRFFSPEHAYEHPLCSELASSWSAPWLLTTAALFHDIAKGRGGDHSLLGERALRLFARQHRINTADTDLMAFLVREHLTLSQTAQKQDLSNPTVIQRFATKMGNQRKLTALYLLTVADICGTSPKIWSSWKAKLLQDLYLAARDVLGGHTPDQHSLFEARRSAALIAMARQGIALVGHLQLWQTLGADYFMQHAPETIAWHTSHIAPYANNTIVRARAASHGSGLEILVYALDEDGLFARICGFFQHARLNILDARAHTSSKGYALDTFQVIPAHPSETHGNTINALQTALRKTLEQKLPLPEPRSSKLSRRAKNFPLEPLVYIEPEEITRRWRITIQANDRMGLLYRIARILASHGIRLQLAKISTMGDRVEDTFLVECSTLQYPQHQAALQRDLLAAISA